MSRSYYVYIMSSKSGVLYIGSTNDLGAGSSSTSKG
jgi:predicted GIY-YIG superfamily endonuclease